MTLNTPVALLIFNRPSLTEKVFARIEEVEPKRLFVIADGPCEDHPDDLHKCREAREVIKVDWDCEVKTNYSEKNLGCAKRVSSGLDWVFSEVEEAIILEDDCLPTKSFFYFCQELLDKYRNDERIMLISGNNFQDGNNQTEYGYYFSKYNHIWGWASWSRAWAHFDYEMRSWPEVKRIGMLDSIFDDKFEKSYWETIFDRMYNENPNSIWDYRWTYACWSQNGLSILPSMNLVSNIGFGEDATHTFGNSPLANIPTSAIWDIKHPPYVIRNLEADIFTFDYIFGGLEMKKNDSISQRVKIRIYSLIRKLKFILTYIKFIRPTKP